VRNARRTTRRESFISHTHADVVSATRIHAFVEVYALPNRQRELCVFLDKNNLVTPRAACRPRSGRHARCWSVGSEAAVNST